MKSFLSFIVLILILQPMTSQEGMPFKVSKKIYMKGSSILIGNNILGEHETDPLNELNLPNDVVKMKYIDVDDDKETFSSSAATINYQGTKPTIAYAALYWTALYPSESSVTRKMGNRIIFKEQGARDSVVNKVLFKMPNANYQEIIGSTIFDSYNHGVFKENSPYVCYADITEQLQSISSLRGTYTLANIKATEGNISGGSSAGWLLYIVYEDPSQKPKYFATYNGLVQVNKEAVEIEFNDFKTAETGDIKTTIALGTLEGDRKIKTDGVSILNNKTNIFQALETKTREPNNFFNSSITLNSEVFMERNPASLNTLGFDLLKMEIPNEKNEIISNNSNQVKLSFQARADRFYLFFVAFETEITNTFFVEKIKKSELIKKQSTTKVTRDSIIHREDGLETIIYTIKKETKENVEKEEKDRLKLLKLEDDEN